ncbi:ROK family protein [Lederbergia wuyishanensis]|uniref:Glucokinase n=1 Tax=Lederbergia wuyishanensis TaxID=1347903 RepID=A0ABU0D910_9BACI|nr:ROK family protein [Lederbergia wuyishanensis]MCJ8009478.1 ROK family protein [Lederbergia wuyishanensis]MDQ0344912.1 glucokinase [Lederbergia wuyishanensis]
MFNQKIVAGIDIGGTKTLIGLVDHSGNILVSQQFPTEIDVEPKIHIDKCIESLRNCMKKIGIHDQSLLGIGVNVPGLADPKKGILIHAPYAGWKSVPVKSYLQEIWPEIPIRIANDVNACALGELVFGRGKEFQHFLWVTISTGIGGGVIIERKIYEGEHFIAGEIGHLVVEWENGNLCGCGNRGCLEAHASGTAIAKMAEKMSLLPATSKNVAELAYNGNKTALDIYKQAGEYIGRALSYAANVLNPGAIIIGGGVSLSYDLLEPHIRTTFQSAVIDETNKSMPILKTALGYEAGLIGAVSLIYSNE